MTETFSVVFPVRTVTTLSGDTATMDLARSAVSRQVFSAERDGWDVACCEVGRSRR